MAPMRSSLVTKRSSPTRIPKCARCRNHGKSAAVKGHKGFCPFKLCICANCELITERQRIVAVLIGLRRDQIREESRAPRLEQEGSVGTAPLVTPLPSISAAQSSLASDYHGQGRLLPNSCQGCHLPAVSVGPLNTIYDQAAMPVSFGYGAPSHPAAAVTATNGILSPGNMQAIGDLIQTLMAIFNVQGDCAALYLYAILKQSEFDIVEAYSRIVQAQKDIISTPSLANSYLLDSSQGTSGSPCGFSPSVIGQDNVQLSNLLHSASPVYYYCPVPSVSSLNSINMESGPSDPGGSSAEAIPAEQDDHHSLQFSAGAIPAELGHLRRLQPVILTHRGDSQNASVE